MKLALQLFALGFLLAGCRKAPSDAQVRRKAAGTWEMPAGHAVVTFEPDGGCVTKVPGVDIMMQGTWRVENGFFVVMMTNAVGSEPHAELGEVQRFKVVSMDSHDLVLQMDGKTNLVVARKK